MILLQKSEVYRVKKCGDSTVPCGAFVLLTTVSHMILKVSVSATMSDMMVESEVQLMCKFRKGMSCVRVRVEYGCGPLSCLPKKKRTEEVDA